jgi:hypothetical protein
MSCFLGRVRMSTPNYSTPTAASLARMEKTARMNTPNNDVGTNDYRIKLITNLVWLVTVDIGNEFCRHVASRDDSGVLGGADAGAE